MCRSGSSRDLVVALWGRYGGVVGGRGCCCCRRGGTTDRDVDDGIGGIACEGLNGGRGATRRSGVFSGEGGCAVSVCMFGGFVGVGGLGCLFLVCHLILGTGLENLVRMESMKEKGRRKHFLIVERAVVEIGTSGHDGMSRRQLLWQSHHTGQKHRLTINQHEKWEELPWVPKRSHHTSSKETSSSSPPSSL